MPEVAALGIWLIREEARPLGELLAHKLDGVLCSTEKGENRSAFQARFSECRQWVFIGTTGIAVRYVESLLASKRSDPAVVVVDEAGRHAVALLSGHEGGANALAYGVANAIGATPVITTATEALKPLILGIGCRKNVSVEQIDAAVRQALAASQRALADVREVATIDRKREEMGLLKWCEEQRLPLRVISTTLVQQRPWVTRSSEWVRQNLEVDGVCEPCALLTSQSGQILVPKTTLNGVAVALVEDGGWQQREGAWGK
jgi:cobalt-precorrin 5A hydrolase